VRFGVPGFFASVPPRQATENDYDDDYEYEHDYNGEQVCWTALLLHAPSAAQDAFRRIVLVLVIRNRNSYSAVSLGGHNDEKSRNALKGAPAKATIYNVRYLQRGKIDRRYLFVSHPDNFTIRELYEVSIPRIRAILWSPPTDNLTDLTLVGPGLLVTGLRHFDVMHADPSCLALS
jgi:hypothetical protein